MPDTHIYHMANTEFDMTIQKHHLFSQKLRQSLCRCAKVYAAAHHISYVPFKSALIFKGDGNFLAPSYSAILNQSSWRRRLAKTHTQLPDARELDSSNSSDALLMNIFCYPNIMEWKGIRELFPLDKGIEKIEPEFGYKAGVPKNGRPDSTEVDMRLGDILVEAKLTELSFTERERNVVEQYDHFDTVFDRARLFRDESRYMNYQLVRNILAAHEKRCRFVLLCDGRRPDLVESFYLTLRGVKIQSLLAHCRIVFWQQVCQNAGRGLQQFLTEKYDL